MPVAAVERKELYALSDSVKDVRLPFAMFRDMPAEVNAETMSPEELSQKLKRGYDDIEGGRVRNAAAAFAEHRKNRKWMFTR